MASSVRPLREVLADLVGDAAAGAGDPEAYLAEHGHPDLPAELVAEAVVSFADTAPPEVAEQLAPFVTAHTAGHENAEGWFDLLTSAPADLDDGPDAGLDGGLDDGLDADPVPWSADDFGPDPGAGLDFGAGALDTPTTAGDGAEVPAPAAPTDWPADPDGPPAATLSDVAAESGADVDGMDGDTDDEDEEPDADFLV